VQLWLLYSPVHIYILRFISLQKIFLQNKENCEIKSVYLFYSVAETSFHSKATIMCTKLTLNILSYISNSWDMLFMVAQHPCDPENNENEIFAGQDNHRCSKEN